MTLITHKSASTVTILGIQIDSLTVSELHDIILSAIQKKQRALILNTNIHCMNLAYENKWLHDFLKQAHYVFCDGAGVRLAALLYGHELPPRITYADWTWQLAEFSQSHELTLFLLGANIGIVDKAAQKLQDRFPNLKIVGTHHGYFDKTPQSEENQAIIQMINAAKPNIFIVGFGMPVQEQWLLENWQSLDTNVILTGGAVFDYISGELQRGPKWMTNYGMEWLARLLIEPRRLWRRYILGNPLFFWRVLQDRLSGTPKHLR